MDRPTTSGLDAALARVGDRWTLLLVEALLDRALRFNDLASAVPGIAPNTLAQRLRHLEREGLVVSELYSERPRRYVYELTARGRELAGAVRLLAEWGAERRDELPRHAACGTPLEVRWYCDACERVVEGPEASDVHFV